MSGSTPRSAASEPPSEARRAYLPDREIPAAWLDRLLLATSELPLVSFIGPMSASLIAAVESIPHRTSESIV